MNSKHKVKSVAVFFNSNELGGAERSMLQQLLFHRQHQPEISFTCFVPLTLQSHLATELKDHHLQTVAYQMPMGYYRFSRASHGLAWLKFFLGLISLGVGALKSKDTFDYDVLYANGNKAALFLILMKKIRFSSIPIYWHWRDYPPQQGFFLRLMRLLIKNDPTIKLIANSFSVKHELDHAFMKNAQVIYNLVGEEIEIHPDGPIQSLGLVGMLAPWKGIHCLVIFSSLYEKQLKELGIEKVKIFGAAIYQTEGEHSDYALELKETCKKYPSSLIEFLGFAKPKEIFKQIDLLIHYSLKPEPFGRVLIEGMHAQIPVLSTCLGGAEEVMQNCSSEKLKLYDYEGLYQQIKKMIVDKHFKTELISQQIVREREIRAFANQSMQEIFSPFNKT
jgi:glycosyltransferase involved in cell wall biosynthesis